MEFVQVITYMDYATIIFAFLAMFFSGKNFWNNRKLSKYIPLYIDKCGEMEFLGIEIMRKDFTRSELLGILRALEKSGRFDILYTSTKDFYTQLKDVQEARKNEFIIYLKDCDSFERK
jgi:hypothetical protein